MLGSALICSALLGPTASSGSAAKQVEAEIAQLGRLRPSFRVIPLSAKGVLALRKTDSMTIDLLRGLKLDPSPPKLGELSKPYDPDQTDSFAAGTAPYEAKEILPFRFKRFQCEFNYGGHHNLKMHDYASAHGFSIIYPYSRTIDQRARMPKGTEWLNWGGFVNYDEWLPKHGVPAGRYDKIGSLDIESELLKEGFLRDLNPADWQRLMIDIEHPLHQLDALRSQPWYPQSSPEPERRAFERAYYQGYSKTITATLAAAKKLGFKNLSIYGWEPFPRTWWGLDKFVFNPKTYSGWTDYGRSINDHAALDALNPSLYVFYWSPQNVASILCNLDFNRELAAQSERPKPIIPYLWTLLHGGDSSHRWWSYQAVPNEESRAWTFLVLMGGVAGFDLWNWSDVGNHHEPRPWMTKVDGKETGSELCIKSRVACTEEGGKGMTVLERYDFIKVLEQDKKSQKIRFQKILKDQPDSYGIGPEQPVYSMDEARLRAFIRADSDPVAGVIEGMALAKPLETLLSLGKPVQDVSSQKQFLETLPIVRRCRLGKYSLIATYDPQVVYGGSPREISLRGFDGRQGLTLKLPADGEVRFWVLKSG